MPAWFKSEINIRKLSTLIGEVFLQNLSIKKQNGYIQIFKSLLKTKNAMNVFQTTPVLIFWQFKDLRKSGNIRKVSKLGDGTTYYPVSCEEKSF